MTQRRGFLELTRDDEIRILFLKRKGNWGKLSQSQKDVCTVVLRHYFQGEMCNSLGINQGTLRNKISESLQILGFRTKRDMMRFVQDECFYHLQLCPPLLPIGDSNEMFEKVT